MAEQGDMVHGSCLPTCARGADSHNPRVRVHWNVISRMWCWMVIGLGWAPLWAQNPSGPPPLEVIELTAPTPVTAVSAPPTTVPPPSKVVTITNTGALPPGYSGLSEEPGLAEPVPSSAGSVPGAEGKVEATAVPVVPMVSESWAPIVLRNTWVPLQTWAGIMGTAPARKVAQTPHVSYEVLAKGGPKVVLRAGSTRMTLNGIDVMLGFLPQLAAGDLKIHRLDVVKTLQPLVSEDLWMLNPTNRLIVLDAGHGGRDAGTTSVDGRTFEKMASLDWARRVQRILEKQGWTVVMTRTNDVEIPLAQRVLLAESVAPPLFVSLHFNSAYPVHSRRGIETYCVTPPGMASSVVREGEGSLGVAFPNNAFDSANLQLAWRVQRAVIQRTGAPDRGVQRARWLGVLRGQRRPAILVEGGYLSNPEEARKIADPAYRQLLAEGVAAGLSEFVPRSP